MAGTVALRPGCEDMQIMPIARRCPGIQLRQAFRCGKLALGPRLPQLSKAEMRSFKALRLWAGAEFPPKAAVADVMLIRCLMARDWDLLHAQQLVRMYSRRLLPRFDPLRTTAVGVVDILDSGALACTGETDVRGASLIEVVLKRFGAKILIDPARCLRATSYVVERALAESDTALRAGVSFVIDLRDVWCISDHISYTKMLLIALQDQYPTKVGTVFILADSVFVQLSLAIFRWGLKPEFKGKVRTLTKVDSFHLELERDQLTPAFGGTVQHNYRAWADRRLLAEGDRRPMSIGSQRKFTDADLESARKIVLQCTAYHARPSVLPVMPARGGASIPAPPPAPGTAVPPTPVGDDAAAANPTKTGSECREPAATIAPPPPGFADSPAASPTHAGGNAAADATDDADVQCLGTALYDWEAKEPDQITFTEGETIVVLDQHESGWWWGRTSRQGEGCFPGNYIVIEAEASGGEPDATPVDELLGPEPEPISGTHRTGSLVSNLETPLPPSPPCGDSATDAAVQARGAPHRWSTPAESDPTAAAAVHASRQHTPTATPRKSTPAPAHPTDAKRLLFAT
eukprot:m.213339 g.213339  ORF g.213339 m.213339 type:complete len:575 (-) comp25558_c0_seq3:89-1813(-)